jgi:hypothetical protein
MSSIAAEMRLQNLSLNDERKEPISVEGVGGVKITPNHVIETDDEGEPWTILECACKYGGVDVMKWLIKEFYLDVNDEGLQFMADQYDNYDVEWYLRNMHGETTDWRDY